jgi:Protein of unknown function (DUF2934)
MNKRQATLARPARLRPKSQPRLTVTMGAYEPAPSASLVPEEMIRPYAYQRWEAAGWPPGDGVQFWLEAERQLSAKDASVRRTQSNVILILGRSRHARSWDRAVRGRTDAGAVYGFEQD